MAPTRIGMTSFIDYLVAQSHTKVAKVRAAQRMMTTDGFDHWQLFRRAAVESLTAGGDKGILRRCAQDAAGGRRGPTYGEAARELEKWIGRKQIVATAIRPGKPWVAPNLEVSINPELRMTVNGGPEMVVKLYFKSEALSKRATQPMLRLIEQTHGTKSLAAILDVRRRSLHVGPVADRRSVDILLNAEAASFSSIWTSL